ncbi:SDR family oxidoreductase [Curtobacterium flaccumfaciens]|uniref:SDR family oxidoreductase n=1 Tax=Curtobacterium flaccumfaciens TaxID=2035 RepID=UPI003441183D
MPDNQHLTVLIVGATGSVGRHVVSEVVRQGHTARALVRDASRAGRLDAAAQVVVGSLKDVEDLRGALDGVDAVVFTHGASWGSADAEAVDYGAVANVLRALDGRRIRIALMTSIGVTGRAATHDWKRRGERLVRASGNPYTIVRPGWFDYNDADQLQNVFLQGDRRKAGNPSDGVIARAQIARVLVSSLTSEAADHTTLELVAERGPAQTDLEPVFAGLDKDGVDSVDGVRDEQNQPFDREPASVLADLRDLAHA